MNKKAIPLLIAVLLISTQIVSATVNPYIDTQEYPFHSYAVGIASYGVYQKGDKLIPYYITTSSVLGYVSLHQVQANSPFSVQMNVMLIVNDQTFWLQNVVVIDPVGHYFYLSSSVLNLTCTNSPLTNIQGEGSFVKGNDGQCYYVNYVGDYRYSLPLSFYLVINVTHTSNHVRILFGFKGINGTCIQGKTIFFQDDVIYIPHVYRASLYVSGYNYLSDSSPYQGFSFYDAELVFGGEGNGKVINFDKLQAYLSLYYDRGGYVPFPSYFDFGSDTAEGTTNLVTHKVGDLFLVTTGRQAYYYLGEVHDAPIHLTGSEIVISERSPLEMVFLSLVLFLIVVGAFFRKIISML
ncbi:thermopsin family protease [Sulfuracidifex metallicus]|uniref:Thermopsin n=1 Tax=Sulfuracidifex metallicus DSM 6482 = JCM 9184 TaxID=523847 RepID=A0A6A9QMY8_SULME|nr:thermopsin family protease [Sulfuracidifex metallicus]MUN29519.1 hypothetical protein [Sulfuracidifex metallicus DSM 6482 = JCM 9184]WOE49970.1 thermopsin family protease [Sulfuracidifex metallicus DSM 6482 = JCM 9184]